MDCLHQAGVLCGEGVIRIVSKYVLDFERGVEGSVCVRLLVGLRLRGGSRLLITRSWRFFPDENEDQYKTTKQGFLLE